MAWVAGGASRVRLVLALGPLGEAGMMGSRRGDRSIRILGISFCSIPNRW